MANTATDLTEEDAADLQFPKELQGHSQSVNRTIDHSLDNSSAVHSCEVCFNLTHHCLCVKCISCLCSLEVPFIECSECENVNICCRCFSNGVEKYSHKSYHKYRIMKHDIVLFEKSNWTAEEELILLDVLFTYGYGNWEIISKKLRNRTEHEIKEHYDKFYLDNPISQLPKVPDSDQSLFPKPIIPYRFRLINVEEPPRFAPNTVGFQSLAGYCASRSDFEIEFDANCENILAKLTEVEFEETHPKYELLLEIQACLVRSYNRRTRERLRRKKIIREHGLILLRKTMSSLHRYENTLTRPVAERLLTFMQLLSGIEFDFLMEGLHRAAELKKRIIKLIEYRKKGITTLQGTEIYDSIKIETDEAAKELKAFESNPQFNWKNLTDSSTILPQNTPNRRAQSKPLDVIGMPGFEKLLLKEQELCSKVRLVPQTYIELKDLLIAENKKLGYLRLQTARKMLKIDVNKTRKLYDFLVEEGYVLKPTS